jgi:hypothetical protein
MGSLSNLYISSSFQSLIHLGNDNTASTSLVELQDGFGNALGVSLNTLGDLDVERQLIVHYGAEITGAVDINTTFSGSTQPFVNQSSTNNLIRITGSYTPTGNQASITEIGIGWLVNGGAVSNARVINVTGTPNSDVTYTINQPLTANNVSYSFTGSIQREVEIEGDLNVSDDLFVGGHLIIEDGVEITGSIDITGNVTASNALIENDLNVGGTLFASKVVTLIESSSVIFSSGSNILGDSILDTQTLNGSIIMSGSSSLTGSMGITGNLNVLGNISSSTISGIGNVTTYSASVQSFISSTSSSISGTITALSQSFSASQFVQDARLNSIQVATASLNLFTASLATSFVGTASFNQFTSSTNAFTASTLTSLANLNAYTASQIILTSSLLVTASFASNNITFTKGDASTFTLRGFATTGSNSFTGNQTTTGNSTFSGSVRGVLNPIAVVSQTASIDCSIGNFFTLSLISESVTRLVATNINPGQTISVRVLQSAPTVGSISYPSNIKFPLGLEYSASLFTSSVDILTFVAYDSTDLYGTVVENFK